MHISMLHPCHAHFLVNGLFLCDVYHVSLVMHIIVDETA